DSAGRRQQARPDPGRAPARDAGAGGPAPGRPDQARDLQAAAARAAAHQGAAAEQRPAQRPAAADDAHAAAAARRGQGPAAGRQRAAPAGPGSSPRLPARIMRRRGSASIVANPVLVGAVTTLVVIVAVFLSYNANNGLPFVPTRSVFVELKNGSELVKGNDVREGGFRVGVVEEMVPARMEKDRKSVV